MSKLIYYSIISFVFLIYIAGCKENSLYVEPKADFEIVGDANNLQLFDTVTFKITGKGNRLTFYPGDANKDYFKNDLGVIVKSDNIFKYVYTSPGTFKATIVATGFDRNGEDFDKVVTTKDVVIVAGGDVGKITRLTFRAANDAEIKYYKDTISNMPANGVLKGSQIASTVDLSGLEGITKNCLVKTIYPNRIWPDVEFFGTITSKKFKYNFNISATTDISAILSLSDIEKNGIKSFYYDKTTQKDTLLVKLGKFAEFKFNEKVAFGNPRYDMYEPILIKSILDGADTLYYNVYMMAYPEMKSFKIGGVTKLGSKHDEIRFNPQQFDRFYSLFNLPNGTDIANLVPEFQTIYPGYVVVKDANGNIIKGDGTDSPMDFSKPVTFTLVFTDPTFPAGFNSVEAYYTVYARVL